jgi:hypothetical protein
MAYVLRIGDPVIWRANFGSAPPVEATVTAIELVEDGSNYGEEVESAPWSSIVGRRAVITLNTGNWAYASQVSPKGPQA